jgi:pyruvate dehydrogenase E1 component alpha subunit
VELLISKKYQEGKMRCPTHLSIGQELVSAAFSCFVEKKDFAISTHRCHAHYIAKGGDLNSMIAEIYGKSTGCSKGRGGSMHLIDLNVNFMGASAIVGNNIPIGVGFGLSGKLKKMKNISYIFLGDGAAEQGVFFESLNFSILKELPVIFMCENNLYSVYSPLNVRQPKERRIYKMVRSLGIKSYKCNGYNYLETMRSLNKAVTYVKKFQKPFFLEFETYRWLEHCGPNDDSQLNYRSKQELNFWKKKDPVIILRKKISKLIGDNKINLVETKINKEINAAFKFAEKSPLPKKSILKNKFVYA